VRFQLCVDRYGYETLFCVDKKFAIGQGERSLTHKFGINIEPMCAQRASSVSLRKHERVLVTGADGFLGCNLVRELRDRGHRVLALIQPGRSTAYLSGLDLELFHGDVCSQGAVDEAAAHCHFIIHTAANTSTSPARSRYVWEVNIKGTLNVIAAAKKNGVRRLVHVGTTNSFGFGTRENPGDETRPYTASKYGLDYFNSKFEAQNIVLREVRENGLPAVVVNPTFMIGPYDSKPGFGAVILALYQGRVPGYPIGGRNYIHVRDVAVGTANALTQGRLGESYILGNKNLSYYEIFTMMAGVLGVEPPKRTFKPLSIKLYGIFGGLHGLVTHKAPFFNLAQARIACDGHYYTPEKARKELGLPQTPIKTAIRDAFVWLMEQGYIEGKRDNET